MNAPRISSLVSLAALSALLGTGCAATQLAPGAERVMVTRQAPPEGCRYLGSVIGGQGGSFLGKFTSNRDLAQGAVNDLKNQAHEMGANYVLLEDTQAGNTISGDRDSMSGGQTDVTHFGNAYSCPTRPVDAGI